MRSFPSTELVLAIKSPLRVNEIRDVVDGIYPYHFTSSYACYISSLKQGIGNKTVHCGLVFSRSKPDFEGSLPGGIPVSSFIKN